MNEFLRGNSVESQNNIGLTEVREMLKCPYVSLVFDFDHTLFNTSNFHRKSFQGALSILGRSLDITPELGAELRGKSDEEILEILLDVSGGVDSALVLQAVNEREKILRQMVKTDGDLTTYFMPHIPDVIRSLRMCEKKSGIASASSDGFIQEFVTRARVDGKTINDVFIPDAIVGGTTVRIIHQSLLSSGVNTPSLNKPNPLSIILSASKVNGHMDDTCPVLYVGDGEVDALSVRGRRNMTGLIVNARDNDKLLGEFAGYGNIAVVRSMNEAFL